MNLQGKSAIVTGSSKGIGRAIAIRLAKEGAAVIVNYSGNETAANETVAMIATAGGLANPVRADVSRPAEVERLFDEAVQHFGSVDILVNNAGMIFHKPIADVSEEEFDRIFAVNVKGTFFACQQAARRLNEGGSIVNFSSTTTLLMLPGYGSYTATKGAVEQLTRALARELGPKKITVNAISPGPTDTELFNLDKTDEDRHRYAQMAALGRIAQTNDIADIVAFLVSHDARWITGQNIRANGGLI